MPQPFLAALADEHRLIRKALEVLARRVAGIEAGAGVDFADFDVIFDFLTVVLERSHHAKEELLLFPRLHRLGSSRLSGPRCSYFMELRMQWDPVGSAMQEVGAERDRTAPPVVSKAVAELLAVSSMLSVPIEEHHAGYYLFQAMKHEVARLRGERQHDRQRLVKLAREYVRLLEVHIQKEDECLFVFAGELLAAGDQERLYQEGLNLDAAIGRDRLEEAIRAMERLHQADWA